MLLVHKYQSHLFEGNIPVGRGPRRLVDLPFPNLNLTKAKEQGGVCVLASTMLGLVPDLLEDPKEDLVRWANRSESCLKEWRRIGPAGGDLRLPRYISDWKSDLFIRRMPALFACLLAMSPI